MISKFFKVVKVLAPTVAGNEWPWRVIERPSCLGMPYSVMAMSDNGWYEYDVDFETVADAVKFIERQALDADLDIAYTRAGGQ